MISGLSKKTFNKKQIFIITSLPCFTKMGVLWNFYRVKWSLFIYSFYLKKCLRVCYTNIICLQQTDQIMSNILI